MRKFWHILKKVFFYLVIIPAFCCGFIFTSGTLSYVFTPCLVWGECYKEDFDIATEEEFKIYCQKEHGQSHWREKEKKCFVEHKILWDIIMYIGVGIMYIVAYVLEGLFYFT